ncbi:MAG: Rieske (2Fe-2S) protein [Candidatus Hodarchaeales archaeon]|jgi:nitrite reductase/ring-hydroxylating ferredoxin subunit
MGTDSWIKVIELESLIEDSCNIYETEIGTIILIKDSENGKVRALSGICSHEEYALETGFVQENTVICPLHLSAFDLDTGEAQNPPAEEPLETFDIKIEENFVFIRKK